MKNMWVDKNEKEVNDWKLKNAAKTSKMNEHEAKKIIKSETEEIKKKYDFNFLNEKEVYDTSSDFLKSCVAEKTVPYNDEDH